VPIMTREQGIGRGLQPITFALNFGGRFAGGDRYTSYFGLPHYITTYNRSLFIENSEFLHFDLLQDDRIRVEITSLRAIGRIIYGDSPLSLIGEYTTYSGRMKPLPDWANKGAIVGMQGGELRVLEILENLERFNTPIGAFWNQDWCGTRIQQVGNSIQKRLWWNWEVSRDVYPNFEQLVSTLKSKGIRMLIYINPFLADVTNKTTYERNLFKEALALGFFAHNPDGSPLLIESGPGIEAGLIDLTNPGLFEWLKQIIKDQMLATGSSGWMADFGEYLPYDALLYNGDSKSFKNLYPQEWARLNYEAVAEMELTEDTVFFMRAAFTRSPTYSPLFWAGDQLPTWDLFDGMKSTIVGMLTAGISGFSLYHSDIGGFTTQKLPPPLPSYVRERELFYRWSELSAFTTTFRSHEGSQPDSNIQFYTDEETYEYFSYCAKMYASLSEYRKDLMQQSANFGYPMARHLFLHYPNDLNVRNIVYNEYLLGEDLLIAPVLDEGVVSVRVYLPRGNWYHVWSEQMYTSIGEYFVVDAPLRQPGVFVREGALKTNQHLIPFLDFVKENRNL